MKNDFTCNSILAKMAIQMDKAKAVYKVDKFNGWYNTQLCHAITVRGVMKRKNPTDKIILVGTKFNNSNHGTYVSHSFLCDRNDQVVVDSNNSDTDSLYEWVPEKGYYQDGRLIGEPLEEITVKEFFQLFFGNAESIPATGIQGPLNPYSKETSTPYAEHHIDDLIFSLYMVFRYVVTGKPVLDDTLLLKLDNYIEESRWVLSNYNGLLKNFNRVTNFILNKAPYTEDANDLVLGLGKDLKTVVLNMGKDTSISQIKLNMVKSVGTWLRKRDSEASKTFLINNVSKLKNKELTNLFSDLQDFGNLHYDIEKTREAQSTPINQLKHLVKDVAGYNGIKLKTEDAQKLREDDPKAYKFYLDMRSKMFGSVLDYLRSYVRQSGDSLVDYEHLKSILDKEGIQHKFPKGFQGFLDEDGNFYTVAKKKIKGKPSTTVTMNPDYDPKEDNEWVFSTPSPNPDQFNTTAYFYTVAYKKQAIRTKFIKAGELGEELERIKRKWRADISPDSDEGICAAVVECLYYFAARIGSLGNETKGESTYGISTLLQKHVRKQGKDFIFKYKGKKGTEQNHTLDTQNDVYRKMAPILDMMMERSDDPKAPFWTVVKNGKVVKLSNKTLRTYWKSLDPICVIVGPHKLRTAEATKMAKDILAKCPFKPGQCDQKEVEEWYKEEMKKIGTRLQHRTGEKETGLTAIKNYIDAELQRDFFDFMGLRQPSFLKDLEEDED